MRLHSRRSLRFLILGALVTAGACDDRLVTTAPRAARIAAIAEAAGDNAQVNVKMMQLSSDTLRIDGPGATATRSP